MGATWSAEVTSLVQPVWVPLGQLKSHHWYNQYVFHLVSWSHITGITSMGATWSAEVTSPLQWVWVPFGQLKWHNQCRKYECQLDSWSDITSTASVGATYTAEVTSLVWGVQVALCQLKWYHEYTEYGYHIASWSDFTSIKNLNGKMMRYQRYYILLGVTAMVLVNLALRVGCYTMRMGAMRTGKITWRVQRVRMPHGRLK